MNQVPLIRLPGVYEQVQCRATVMSVQQHARAERDQYFSAARKWYGIPVLVYRSLVTPASSAAPRLENPGHRRKPIRRWAWRYSGYAAGLLQRAC